MIQPWVTLYPQVFDEARLATLAEACALTDNDHALGKISRLWRASTQRQHYTLSQPIIRGLLGPDGVDGLIVAELGELVELHMPTKWAAKLGLTVPPVREGEWVMRLCGTRGRIEKWGAYVHGKRSGGHARAKQRAAERAAAEAVDNSVDDLSIDAAEDMAEGGSPCGQPGSGLVLPATLGPAELPQNGSSPAAARQQGGSFSSLIPDPDLRSLRSEGERFGPLGVTSALDAAWELARRNREGGDR